MCGSNIDSTFATDCFSDCLQHLSFVWLLYLAKQTMHYYTSTTFIMLKAIIDLLLVSSVYGLEICA